MNYIYGRLNLIWNSAILASETDKIKNIKYESDYKSSKDNKCTRLTFDLIKKLKKIHIDMIKTEEYNDSHISLYYSDTFLITGTSDFMNIRPNTIFVNYSPTKISSMLEEIEIALHEAGVRLIHYDEQIKKFNNICKNVISAYYSEEIKEDTYKELQKESKYIKVDDNIIEVRYVGSDPGISYFSCVERINDPDYENIYITYFNKDEEPIYFNIYDYNNGDWVALIGFITLTKPKNEIIEFSKKVIDTYRNGEWFYWERK